jgi:hypothetical protein
MSLLMRVRAVWNGIGPGGTGVNTLYFTAGGTSVLSSCRAFYQGVQGYIPTGVTIGFPSSGDVIEDSTGLISGSWSETAVTAVSGSSGGGGVGARVAWHTGARRGRRPVTGSTFFVPMGGGICDTSGTLDATFQATLAGGANALIAASSNELMIWSRPTAVGTDGISHPVLSATVADQVSWLTSRRH